MEEGQIPQWLMVVVTMVIPNNINNENQRITGL
jgi:hypothetical protein